MSTLSPWRWAGIQDTLTVGQRLPLVEMEAQGDLRFGVRKQLKVETSCRYSAKLPSAECGVRGRVLD